MKTVSSFPSWSLPKPQWRIKWLRFLSLILISGLISFHLLIISPPANAAASEGTLQVATRQIPPFVMKDKGKLTGFSIELWEKIAQQMGKDSNLTVYPSLPQMLSAVEQRKADLAIAAISITAARYQKFDFSLPIYNSGLQILVRNVAQAGLVPNLIEDLLSPTILQIIGLALGMVVAAAHLIWLLERHHPESSISEKYFPGIFEAAWWSASTLATQAEEMPRGAVGRVMAIFWMFISVLFVAYFTATVTTGMTVQKLQGDIKGINDLSGRIVATTAGSTAAEFLHDKQIKTLEVDRIEDAYEALLSRKADAVISDAPVLLYYAAHEGKGKVQLVGEMMREEDYGIILTPNSPYRKPINSALLKLKENGTYQTLYDQWFKTKPENE